MKPHSIVRRLIITVLLMELLSVLCLAGVALLHERRERFRAFDVMLRGRADSLLGAVQDAEDAHDNLLLDRTGLDLPSEDVYQIRDESGNLVGQSANWGTGPKDGSMPSADGFFKMEVNDRHYRGIRTHAMRIIDMETNGDGIRKKVVITYGVPTKPLRKAIASEVRFYALASIVFLTVTGVLLAWFLNRGLAPLREIAAKASTVSATSWMFDPSEDVMSTKELGPLARTLQRVLKDLEYSFMRQRRFVSDAAHELKTAVAVVQSSIQVLGVKPRSVAEYQNGLDRCHADSIRMEEIVGKMLTLARQEREAGVEEASFDTDLASCLRLSEQQLSSVAALGDVKVLWMQVDGTAVPLPREDCEILCSNLLLNAVQHSEPGSQVSISAIRQGDWVEMRIEDQGNGITPEALPFVFEPFYRSDPSRNRKTGGTGLGLAICKAIVDRVQGQIGMTSTPGVGTVVIVRLPVGRES
jgi:signal transduction histidine kinase